MRIPANHKPNSAPTPLQACLDAELNKIVFGVVDRVVGYFQQQARTADLLKPMVILPGPIVTLTTTARTNSRICSLVNVGQTRQRALAATSSICASAVSSLGWQQLVLRLSTNETAQ